MVQVKRNADWNLLIEAKLAFFFVKVTILIFFGKIILRESDRKIPCFVKYHNRPIEAVQERIQSLNVTSYFRISAFAESWQPWREVKPEFLLTPESSQSPGG